ncbi:RagB/SusD family nutrient uptake outer membrane protein [Longitalea luteola]|uniref:RagB/SusD family nutrient uptake outer membrane protein n=1 Tax=Longitalea luteola TaxID=2812563 RepID=UPI001A96E784|nr:RagB/SusD family nutrient uptake outer membrane protein [Longitalea luteola]
MTTKNKVLIIAASLLTGFTSCKKDFLEEKRDLGGVNEEVFKDSVLAQAYVDFVYGMFQAPSNAQSLSWNLATNNIQFAQTTDEFPGQTNWNREWATVSYLNPHALNYFGPILGTSTGNNTWTRIRQINLFLDNIDQYGLPADVRTRLKGQLYFWRGWQYFDLVRLYGGVPLVLHAQDPVGSLEKDDLKVPRSSTSACIEQICLDLDSAIAMLPGKWISTANADWGRITSGAAAAVKGRVLLTWASPQFNRNDDVARWQRAYDANKKAKEILEANGFGLFKSGNLSDGTAWDNMFQQEVNNPEAVLVFGFNNVLSDQIQKWNGWENSARPKEINGNGGLNPSKQIMDAFPMKDGKAPGASSYTYDPKKFYKNRDPRFYKTFAYNGALWPYAQNPRWRVWTYRWHDKANAATPTVTTELKGANTTGIYVRKATAANASNSNSNFANSGTDFMELRFAEVLLNLAECAIGIGNIQEGIDQVVEIRKRAGIESADNYGLGSISGRDAAFAAVLNERKIELAFEGKRFFDLRRWMLFTNEFGTTARLGVQPLQGTRRSGLFIYVKKLDGTKFVGSNKQDPMFKPQNDGNILIDREPVAFPAGITTQDQYLDYLYDNYFEVIEKTDADPSNNWKFTWYKEYYFFGFNETAINNSPYLEQTQGWNGLHGAGTFDPLK